MNNLDDLFTAQSEQKNVTLTSFNKEEWSAKKQIERQQTFEMVDTMANAAANERGVLQQYLDVQARFDRYSVANALLITGQMPKATKLASFDDWKKQRVFVQRNEKGIVLLEPGNEYTREDGSIGLSYNVKKVFDVSQTDSHRRSTPNVTHDIRLVLKALINQAPCRLDMTNDIQDGVGAVYQPESRTILIRQGMSGEDIFRCLSQEMVHAYMDKGNRGQYDRDQNALVAHCASYMLCRRYGIPTDGYQIDRAAEAMRGMDVRAIRDVLGDVRDTANDISFNMYRELHPREVQNQENAPR